MSAIAAAPARPWRYLWLLMGVQTLLVAAYAYAAIAFLTTSAEFFPEQAPPVS